MPLSDRDYMKPRPMPRERKIWIGGGTGDFLQNPVFILILINLIIYIAAQMRANDFIINMGLSPNLFSQKPWTIMTNMFLHVDFWHLFGNMITLYFFGQVIYKMIGKWWFLLLYIGGGIAGNLLYVLIGDSASIAYGASGAVYALAGALVVVMPKLRVAIWGVIPMPLWAVVVLFFGVWSIPGIFANIAWQAHLGGMAGGLIAGYIIRKKVRFIY